MSESEPKRQANPQGPSSHELALRGALDSIEHGVLVLGPDSTPTFVNAYAKRILERRAGLSIGPGGIESPRTADTRAVRNAVALAATGALKDAVAFRLPRELGTRPLFVHVTVPNREENTDQAVVFVCDPDHSPQFNAALLIRMFALTRSEAVIASLLMQGRTIEQIADQLCISINTGRTHLKRILLKTETSRQGELIRLLLVSCAQVRVE